MTISGLDCSSVFFSFHLLVWFCDRLSWFNQLLNCTLNPRTFLSFPFTVWDSGKCSYHCLSVPPLHLRCHLQFVQCRSINDDEIAVVELELNEHCQSEVAASQRTDCCAVKYITSRLMNGARHNQTMLLRLFYAPSVEDISRLVFHEPVHPFWPAIKRKPIKCNYTQILGNWCWCQERRKVLIDLGK